MGTVAVLALSVVLVRRGELSIGSLLALVRFSQLVADPLWTVAEQLAEAQKAVAGTRRAARLLGTEVTIVDGPDPLPPEGALAAELHEVTFGYGTGRPVLDGVDLVVPAGSTLGIVGRTGSGKTTVGRLLARLWDTEAGTVSVGGIDVRRVGLGALRTRVAVVTQEVEVFRASVRDNLTLFGAVEVADSAVVDALVDAGLDVWLASLPAGLDTALAGSGDLSAGEAQLLAFARVLLTDPGLVILDEASSRLDPASEERLSGATSRLLSGRTAIVIAHRLSTLDTVDAICVLDHGRVVEHGPRQQLADDPSSRYAALVSTSQRAELVVR